MTNNYTQVRAGCKDIWNAFMAEGATFCKHDIPFCPTTARRIPKNIITWTEAKSIYKKHLSESDYKNDSFVCFYIDDFKFDGPRGIWINPFQTLEVLKHFSGAITPDFSTYQDFPEYVKGFATYRMRLMGYWWGRNGIEVINNVRWGTKESFDYCFEGIPTRSIVAIGTVGGGPRKLVDRERFEIGLFEMINQLHPKTIVVYGSAKYPCFFKAKEMGIDIVEFSSHTAKFWEGQK